MKEYYISVVVPIYKVEKYIERCLKSLFSQTIAEHCEFILVNDCSPDDSFIIANRVVLNFPHLRENIVFIDKKKNEGLSAARYDGILRSSGKYIIHIDSDDWCELDMFEQLYMKAEEKNADIVNCDIVFEYENYSKLINQNPGVSNIDAIKRLLNGEYGAYLCIKLIKKSLYDKYKILPNRDISMWEDLNLAIPLYSKAKIVEYVKKGLYHYERSNLNSICNNLSEKYVTQLLTVVNSKISYLNDEYGSSFDESIKNLKIRSKCFLLIQLEEELVRKYGNIYSEIDDFILSNKYVSIFNRFITFLYCKRFYAVATVLLKLKWAIKKICK